MTRDEQIDTACREWGAAIDVFRADQTKENKERAEEAQRQLISLIEELFGLVPAPQIPVRKSC